MENFIVIAIILLIVGGATIYIIKAKKSGKKCIGCPDSAVCQSKNTASGCGGNCGNCSSCDCNK